MEIGGSTGKKNAVFHGWINVNGVSSSTPLSRAKENKKQLENFQVLEDALFYILYIHIIDQDRLSQPIRITAGIAGIYQKRIRSTRNKSRK